MMDIYRQWIGNGDSLEVFCLFSMFLKDKVFKFQVSNLSYVWYICYIPRHWKRRWRWLENGENLATKITINNLQILLCRRYEIRKDSQKNGQRLCNAEMRIHFFHFQLERGSPYPYALRSCKSPFSVKWNLSVY